jgi:Xaa-Pro aminopeptidase
MSANLSDEFVTAAMRELQGTDIDAWLLYDLEARNRVAAELVGLPEGQTRRYFILLQPGKAPHALAHRIELGEWTEWKHDLDSYVSWQELEARLTDLLDGCQRVAMEVSPGDAVPFMDNVPAGVVELVEGCGVKVVSSAELISRTYAQWGQVGRTTHRHAAEILATTAHEAFLLAGRAVSTTAAASTEHDDAGPDGACGKVDHDLVRWIVERLEQAGLTEADTIVAIGPNSALPHYWPEEVTCAPLEAGKVLLIDLWARVADQPAAVFADQTWMGFLGDQLPGDVTAVWDAVRAARDAGVEFLVESVGKELPSGADVDARVRDVLDARGFAEAIFHRTGHGMDRVNHGFGPNLDCVETRDERRLVPGIGFSVEPGLYFEGRFGVRSEINVHLTEAGPEVSPSVIQEFPWLLSN